MRKTRLTLLVIAIVASTMIPTAAFAASGAEAEECATHLVEDLAAGKITEKEAKKESIHCFSSPSPILPATAELLWGGIAFAIVAIGLMKFGFPAVKKGLAAREDKIRQDLADAETSKQEAAAKAQEYDDKLSDARAEASRIIEEAKTQAGDVKADLVAKAEDEAANIRAKAQSDAEAIKASALNDIQTQVAELSVELAEKVVQNSLDKKAQLELVNGYIADLSKSSKN